MRRTATLALLTATLMVGGSSAALAQAGPPSDVPQPPAQAQAQGSAQTGDDNSAQGRATAGDNAQAQGSAETGQENSADGRAKASENSGIDVPARDEAREDGRAFGEQRADDAQARGDDATDNNNGNPGDTEEPADTEDVDDVTDPDAPEVELPDEAPAQADQARGVLATITATFESVLTTLQNLLGMAPASA